jgi:hypothetical protein
VSRIDAAGWADVIMRVLVKAVEAENSLPRVLWAGRRDVESQPFIAAAEAVAVSDGHAHSRLLEDYRIALRLFHQSTLRDDRFALRWTHYVYALHLSNLLWDPRKVPSNHCTILLREFGARLHYLIYQDLHFYSK